MTTLPTTTGCRYRQGRGIRASLPACAVQRANAIVKPTEPQSRPIMVADDHSNLLPPQVIPRRNVVVVAAKMTKPIGSSFLCRLATASRSGGFFVSSGIDTIKVVATTTPPRGRKIQKPNTWVKVCKDLVTNSNE